MKEAVDHNEALHHVALHYDALIDEGVDFVNDPVQLREYMNKWDGERFIRQLRTSREMDVLEIGVGTGRLAIQICNKCKTFTGIDISPKTIKRANQNLRDCHTAELICGDFLSYDFDRKFDLIYSSLTFMHIDEKEKAIHNIKVLLNSQGRFVLSIDKNQDTVLDYGSRKLRIYPDNPNEIIHLLEKTGMALEEQFDTEFAVVLAATNTAL